MTLDKKMLFETLSKYVGYFMSMRISDFDGFNSGTFIKIMYENLLSYNKCPARRDKQEHLKEFKIILGTVPSNII